MAENWTAARERMVNDQLLPRGIRDPRVLGAMRQVERERYVPAALTDHAYDDGPLPIGSDQTISQPYMVALMSQVAACDGHERVLEVGTGSGYQTAILASLAAEVFSIECLPELQARASVILAAMGLHNVHLRCGDGSDGWSDAAPFDVVIVTAAMPGIARPLLAQLGVGGRLVAPVGEADLQTLVRISNRDGRWQEEYFGDCLFVKMTGKLGFGN